MESILQFILFLLPQMSWYSIQYCFYIRSFQRFELCFMCFTNAFTNCKKLIRYLLVGQNNDLP